MSKKEEKITVTVLRPTFLRGEPLEVGKSKTLDKADALDLIAAGKAKEVGKVTEADKESIEKLEAKLKLGEKLKKDIKPSEIALIPSVKRKAGSSEADTKALAEQKAAEARVKAIAEKLMKHTKPELQAMLDEKEIAYEGDANKDALVALLVSAEEK